jgi:hypothetical protein
MNVSDKPMETNDAAKAIRRGAVQWNNHAVDSAVKALRSGYVVLRMGQGADSRLLAQINRKEKSYSHCGIVMVENGYPFVYHSIGGEDNPDERMRRDSAKFFFSPLHNTGFAIVRYDYTAGKVDELQQVVREYYALRPKFDMQFDLATDDKLYCSEFVYKAISRVMNDAEYIPVTTALNHTFVGIDDLYLNKHASRLLELKFR